MLRFPVQEVGVLRIHPGMRSDRRAVLFYSFVAVLQREKSYVPGGPHVGRLTFVLPGESKG